MANIFEGFIAMFKYQLLLLSLPFLLSFGPKLAGSSNIGVCYTRTTTNNYLLPSPKEVVSMYQANHIGRMRLYGPDFEAYEALHGSGIQVIVGVDDEDIEPIATSYDEALEWVNNHIVYYWPDVHFRYISVGNEVIPTSSSAKFILPAIQNLHNALGAEGLWQRIKVTTVVSPSVMDVYFPPSAGNLSETATQYLQPIAQYLYNIGAPLLANVYPYFDYVNNPKHVSLPYALFTANGDVFTDSGLGYSNSFDAMVDALYAALEKVGAPKLPVVVSETGWPSAGCNSAARVSYAQTYNLNLIKHVLSSQGTPKRPGVPIETYLFAMFSDEDRNMEGKKKKKKKNNFGLFNTDMKPVYPIDFNVTMS